jgi:hypothetical protein
MQKSGSEATLLGMFFHDPSAWLGGGVGGNDSQDHRRRPQVEEALQRHVVAADGRVLSQDAQSRVGGRARMARCGPSRDGGETWSVVCRVHAGPALRDYAFVTLSDKGLAGGRQRHDPADVTDGGENWTDQASGTSAALALPSR